ncbi:adenosylmethionine-8-amino-7-oxononanoate aminotransferase [Wenyingzhuangia fucanilytica]|uniref:Adenosylmethionine-8-amino-7-oxononanoate aminotransferase n=1 Tax=Wenyingzhuangia fucanilytica TaxID=1790137 RepID=A0A1B1Y299_9FLAO|nr:adenosylmethionine--8-amino-7-oxononanoate transaminase [Wenyingzhuangia fucanilytica]ANW94894.1 adenosylmethionine-8-amino-7-oxononanoate aminotransferase [Wenyingzhuangia fucanilytica]
MSLNKRDQKHLWHPLTQHKMTKDHLAIKSAKGIYLYDEQGHKYIDAISSWYTCVYGHCHPQVVKKVTDQVSQLDQVVFAGFTHEPAVELSEKLMEILPSNQQKIFFSDNGSTTVDIAMKMSLQYHFNQGKKKLRIIAFENAFHGDTFGAMSVSGLDVYNGPFEDVVLNIDRISVPNDANLKDVINAFTAIVETDEVACFVFEPLVQGANCMRMHKAEHLDMLIEIAQKNDVICVADEVMTGFGKTGSIFAADELQNKPDIMCLSKALTAGMVPMGLTTCTQKIYDAFYADEIAKGFFHGHTYSANPITCAAAIASIELIQSDEIQQGIKMINQNHLIFADKLRNHSKVENIRVKGVILAIDLNISIDRYGKDRNVIFNYFMDKGIYLRPLGNTLYIVPPYIMQEEQLNFIYEEIFRYIYEA